MTSNLINGLYLTKNTARYLIPGKLSSYANYFKTKNYISRSAVDLNYLHSCYCTLLSTIWETFSEFLMFCNLFQEHLGEYEKRGKYVIR